MWIILLHSVLQLQYSVPFMSSCLEFAGNLPSSDCVLILMLIHVHNVFIIYTQFWPYYLILTLKQFCDKPYCYLWVITQFGPGSQGLKMREPRPDHDILTPNSKLLLLHYLVCAFHFPTFYTSQIPNWLRIYPGVYQIALHRVLHIKGSGFSIPAVLLLCWVILDKLFNHLKMKSQLLHL